MKLRVKTGGKIIIALVITAALVGALKVAGSAGLLPAAGIFSSLVPKAAQLPSVNEIASRPAAAKAPLPSATPVGAGEEVRALVWAWNAQMGWMFANGGPVTTKGSLMEKHGVTNLKLIRQDDANQMQNELIKFARELKAGSSNPAGGTHFVAIMGDGAAAFLAGVNPQLEKLGKEYVAQVVGSAGYSRGEDKFMGPEEWKRNPQAAKGGVVAGVLRDGDWNIAMKWCADNKIKTNPDEKTYDPEALNWVSAESYTKAAEMYVAGYSEERPVVKQGKPAGEKKSITVNAVVTWTPGDVTVAKKKGGLVSIVSTREYYWQMPNTIIGIKKWMDDNPQTVEGMLAAIFEGGDQVRSYPEALSKASEISSKVYNEESPAYWERYYKGVTEADAGGKMVELGGSSVNGLADNLFLFGLLPGSSSIFASTYTVFGDIVVQQYPKLVPSYPAVKEVVNTRFLEDLGRNTQVTVEAAQRPTYSAAPITDVVSRRSWTINFRTGSADFTPQAEHELRKLFDQLSVTSLAVEVHGHTDNVGSADANQALSEKRAFAVKQWLKGKSSVNFPEERVRVFAHGQSNPVAPNATAAGKAQNRRVEIVLGSSK